MSDLDIELSIIVPVYNVQGRMRKCLDSLNRLPLNYEVIFIDDGSTDDSFRELSNFSKKKSNITVITQENSGVSAARNKGIDFAKGKWLCFVDADDYLVEGWEFSMAQALSFATDDQCIILSQNANNMIYDKYEAIRTVLGDKKSPICNSIGLSWVFSKLYPQRLIKENGIRFVDGLINGEDMLFNCSIFMVSEKIIGYNTGIYCFCKNMESSTNIFDLKFFTTEKCFHESLLSFYKKYNLNSLIWNEIYEIGLLTGIFAVLYRVALTKQDYSQLINDEVLSDSIYRMALENLNKYKGSISIYKFTTLLFVKHKNIKTAIKMVKLFCYIKKLYYRKNDGILLIV